MKLNFSPHLFHIYGALNIQVYGFFIVLAIFITVWAIRHNKRFKDLHLEPVYLDITLITIIAACFGGRLIEIISEPELYQNWSDWYSIWQGGFSALGAILGVICITPLYLKRLRIPVLPTCDLVAIYAPLLQSIARLGCFAAGCCYGTCTDSPLGVIYTHSHTLALQGIPIHPTQLYSSLLLFIIFLGMYLIGQKIFKKPGQLLFLYLILVSGERFMVDFWRADRIMINSALSFHQIIALSIILIFSFLYVRSILRTKVINEQNINF
jgi:phosphatidylglycerol---prolipoprotein diacylglyceryl transferase